MSTPPGPEAAPSEEELRAFEEQMSRISVEDVIVQTTVTLVNLAGRRLGLTAPGGEAPPDRDLGQARLAIDGVRALLPLLPEGAQPIRDALSQLQVAYAQEAGAAGDAGAGAGAAPGAPGQPGEPAPAEPASAADPAPEEAERARARAKIWTPGS